MLSTVKHTLDKLFELECRLLETKFPGVREQLEYGNRFLSAQQLEMEVTDMLTIENFPYAMNEKQLRVQFSQHGIEVVNIEIIDRKATASQSKKREVFVKLASAAMVEEAVQKMDKLTFVHRVTIDNVPNATNEKQMRAELTKHEIEVVKIEFRSNPEAKSTQTKKCEVFVKHVNAMMVEEAVQKMSVEKDFEKVTLVSREGRKIRVVASDVQLKASPKKTRDGKRRGRGKREKGKNGGGKPPTMPRASGGASSGGVRCADSKIAGGAAVNPKLASSRPRKTTSSPRPRDQKGRDAGDPTTDKGAGSSGGADAKPKQMQGKGGR
jgi:hypothetical protein